MNRTEWFDLLQNRYPDINAFSEIEHTFRRVDEYFRQHECIFVSVSGGSDSDCIVHLICTYFPEYLEKCHFVFVNTGLEYRATISHLDYLQDRYGIVIERIRGVSVVTVVRKYGLPILSKDKAQKIRDYFRGCQYAIDRLYPDEERKKKMPRRVQFTPAQLEMVEYCKRGGIKIADKCCDLSKKKPIKEYMKKHHCDLNVTGERKCEGGIRGVSHQSCFEVHKNGEHKFMPLWWWSNETKAQFKAVECIRYSDCYEVWGMKRTGCVGCPFNLDIAEDLQRMAIYEPNMYKACMNVFGQSYELMDRFNCRRKKCLPETIQMTIDYEVRRSEHDESPMQGLSGQT